jgi:regulator of protease activity HflC (stomatin/prohibitin superfamily)
MFRVIVSDTQRAVLFKDGRMTRWLEPGRHRFFGFGAQLSAEFLDLDTGWAELTPELSKILPAGAGDELVVERGEMALVSVDGRPKAVLVPGRYVLWQLRGHTTAVVKSTKEVVADVPQAFWPFAPTTHLATVIVHSYERVLLYVDGAVHRVLEAGAYALHKDERAVELVRVSLRETETPITGQEVMTSDKVTLRMNVAVRWRIVDALRGIESTVDLTAAVYTEAQMAVRRHVSGRSLEELLVHRVEAAVTMRGELAERVSRWGVDVTSVDLKDVVLPGDMKALLNKVVEATKQAEANVILRREETAATRSLANTARMLAESPTLMRLKELEVYREMAERVGQITVVVSPTELVSKLGLSGGQ